MLNIDEIKDKISISILGQQYEGPNKRIDEIFNNCTIAEYKDYTVILEPFTTTSCLYVISNVTDEVIISNDCKVFGDIKSGQFYVEEGEERDKDITLYYFSDRLYYNVYSSEYKFINYEKMGFVYKREVINYKDGVFFVKNIGEEVWFDLIIKNKVYKLGCNIYKHYHNYIIRMMIL